MHAENSIIMKAPLESIFRVAADLSLWPKILPHYRWVRYLEKSTTRNLVQMAARRNWIPIKWTSEQEIDTAKMEVRFHHLKAFTKGMRVVWNFTPTPHGVEVRIRHDLKSRIPVIGNFIANVIVGKFFIEYVANQTLMNMKKFVEQSDEA
jgi:ribosome-associated toxin RatA of RatAB toxin-antitoxin module